MALLPLRGWPGAPGPELHSPKTTVGAISWGHQGLHATPLPSAPTPGSPAVLLSVQEGRVGALVPQGSRGPPQ